MSKFAILLVSFVTLTVLTSCGGPANMIRKDVTPTASSIKPEPGKAALVITRTTSFGGAIEFNTYLDKKLIGVTKGKSYFAKTDIEPGAKYVISWGENGEAVKVDFKSDTVYFLQNNVSMGVWKARVVMEALDAKRLDGGELEGCTYYVYDQSKPGEDLTDEDYKDVIQGADTLVVKPDGSAELVEAKK